MVPGTKIWGGARRIGAVLLTTTMAACAPVPGEDTGALPGVGALDVDTLPAGVTDDFSEAPELFQLSGVAIWDGARTVPGVWVAHPTARGTMQVRIAHTATGAEVDGRIYRAGPRADGDVITLSSDAARALGLEPGRRARLSIRALVPGDLAAQRTRQDAERTARSALSGYAATLDHDRLAQLVGALMRGMGYRTEFDDGLVATDGGAGIRAVAATGAAVRVAVRAGGGRAFSGRELATFGSAIGPGDVGLVVSVPGFAGGVGQGAVLGGSFVQTLDLDGLLHLWVERYRDMAETDRLLMPLQPVYFLAAN